MKKTTKRGRKINIEIVDPVEICELIFKNFIPNTTFYASKEIFYKVFEYVKTNQFDKMRGEYFVKNNKLTDHVSVRPDKIIFSGNGVLELL